MFKSLFLLEQGPKGTYERNPYPPKDMDFFHNEFFASLSPKESDKKLNTN